MSKREKLGNPAFQELLESGQALREDVNLFLKKWGNQAHNSKSPNRTFWKQAQEQKVKIRSWFNLLDRNLLPVILYERRHLNHTLSRVLEWVTFQESDLEGEPYPVYGKYAQDQINKAMDEVLTLILSVPPNSPSLGGTTSSASVTHKPNTAFILMWMDPDNRELDDVVDTIKGVCEEFDIQAARADDEEHSGVITELVLEKIRSSEFLLVDLTGERPNVYYELGYAHAIGKRPILFRKEETKLHFDIAGYNVPPYANNRELRDFLRRRLEAMTNRSPKENPA